MKKHGKIFIVILLCFLVGNSRIAKSEISRKNSLIRDISQLSKGLRLSVKDTVEEVHISYSKIKSRVMRYKKDNRVEPIRLKLKGQSLMILSEKLAKRGHTVYLYQEMKKALRKINNPKEITVTQEILRYMDKQKLVKLFSSRHHRLILLPQQISKRKKSALINQVKYFFSSKEVKKIRHKLKKSSQISVGKDLLPEFAAKMVRRYTIFRGPNCFHAVLAFQDSAFPKSMFMNVKEETGYHRAMINHDELWRVLEDNFYEVQPGTSKLKFGDIIVFFKVPKNSTELPTFKWLKHTSVYLFNNYTFSKGSKSSNSPYTIKTLNEEWIAWKKILHNPAIKVFRRASHKLNKKFTANLKDWLY